MHILILPLCKGHNSNWWFIKRHCKVEFLNKGYIPIGAFVMTLLTNDLDQGHGDKGQGLVQKYKLCVFDTI